MDFQVAPGVDRSFVAPKRQSDQLFRIRYVRKRSTEIKPSTFARCDARAAPMLMYASAFPGAGHDSKITAIIPIPFASALCFRAYFPRNLGVRF